MTKKPAKAQTLRERYDNLLKVYKGLNEHLHDKIVGEQAAVIEWQHGRGAEAGMQWIANGLSGPGLLPDPDEPYGKEAQAYFSANKSHPFPLCACGRPSYTTWGVKDGQPKGACSQACYETAKKLEKH